MPCNVQVNFDIPLFEGLIDTNALEKWLSLLKGYYLFKISSRSYDYCQQ
jgi:hypothetical protein